jgi:hypothetical protein
MDIKRDIYGIDKLAGGEHNYGGWGTFFNFAPNVAANAGVLYTTYLLAASVLAGTAIGAGTAKLTAHGERDVDTVRKSYDNQRLMADIGYLKGKVRQEYDAQQNKTAPKAARIFN